MTTRTTVPIQPARNRCQAIAADTDVTQYCPYRAWVSSLCRQYADELRTLEERYQVAEREVGRLRPVVEENVAEGADAYIRVRDVRRDERVVQLYSQSLGEQINAAVELKTWFLSECDPGSASDTKDIVRSNAGWRQKGAVVRPWPGLRSARRSSRRSWPLWRHGRTPSNTSTSTRSSLHLCRSQNKNKDQDED